MSKNTLKVLSGIFAAIILTLLLITFSVDRVVKTGIEESGSELLQTEVAVDKVSISVFGGSGTIEGLTIKNPESFSDESALFIQNASIKVDLGSLLSDQVIVNEIIINSPEILFEQEGVGINLKRLSDNMDAASGEPSESSETKLVVEHLRISEGKIVVNSSLNRDGSTEVSLSDITVNDIGRDGNNTVKQSVEEILRPLFQKAIEDALKSGVTEQIEDKVRDLFGN
ncbi:DUF748 domain-containing protein [Gracilimonas amylolytica]|uniref:DUF748 domain-containing protein n=1 Tax=Gracilimonas amylolytica TaxID=1749045 RepID=UPI000CD92691|nr:hypothetical protein [Gracilimonas amylolytica]